MFIRSLAAVRMKTLLNHCGISVLACMTLGFVPIVRFSWWCPEHLWLLPACHLFYNDVRLGIIVRFQVEKQIFEQVERVALIYM